MARTVAFASGKGGVGRTYSAYHLGGTLVGRGYRVLLVDADPQSSLTHAMIGPVARSLGIGHSIAALFDKRLARSPRDLIMGTACENLWLLPSHASVTAYDWPSPWSTNESPYGLRNFASELSNDFDFILIDCSRDIRTLAWSALLAADGVVIPILVGDSGVCGEQAVVQAVSKVYSGWNQHVRVLGCLISMIQRSRRREAIQECALRRFATTELFSAVMPFSQEFQNSFRLRVPVSRYRAKSAAAIATEDVADELILRLEPRALTTNETAA